MASFRAGFLLCHVFERMCNYPDDYEAEEVLTRDVQRWRDLPPKQLERLRLGGDQSLVITLGCKSLQFFF